jgi:hypothetical protein
MAALGAMAEVPVGIAAACTGGRPLTFLIRPSLVRQAARYQGRGRQPQARCDFHHPRSKLAMLLQAWQQVQFSTQRRKGAEA